MREAANVSFNEAGAKISECVPEKRKANFVTHRIHKHMRTDTHLKMDDLSAGTNLWQGTWMADVDDGAN